MTGWASRIRFLLYAFAIGGSANLAVAQVSTTQITPLPNVPIAKELATAGSVPLGTVLTDLITKGADAPIISGLSRTATATQPSGGELWLDAGAIVNFNQFRTAGRIASGAIFNPLPGTVAAMRRGYLQRPIELDSRFENNIARLASLPDKPLPGAFDNRRIWNGVAIPDPDPFGDAVALTGTNDELCSGTLIAPDTIVTAGHCYCGGAMNEAVIGRSVISAVERVPIDRARSKALHSCDQLNKDLSIGDIALVKLTRPVSVPPRKIAPLTVVRDAAAVRAVGFGRTQTGSTGFKYQVNIVIASVQCEGTMDTGLPDHRVYGCRPSYELVAASLNRDTCGGDSGGPIYVFGPDASLYLVGLTSRAVDPSGRCGPGGVYVLLSASPIREWLADNGVALGSP